MNFIADENIDQAIIMKLRSVGHIILSIGEMNPGISDEEVLEIANHQGAVLLTSDKDFGELVFRDHRYTFGIVLIRLFGISAENKANKIHDVIKEHGAELVNSFTLVTLDSVRIRPRLF